MILFELDTNKLSGEFYFEKKIHFLLVCQLYTQKDVLTKHIIPELSIPVGHIHMRRKHKILDASIMYFSQAYEFSLFF